MAPGPRRQLLTICTAVVLLAPLIPIQAASIGAPRRQLLQSTAFETCPDGCTKTGCVRASNGWRCLKCGSSLMLDQTGRCACPAGRYAAPVGCLDCAKGHWCPGGVYSSTDAKSAPRKPCGPNLTTLGLRSALRSECVNLPGSSYSLDAQGTPTAVPCPADAWSPGLKKQQSCEPCPPGFSTAGMTQATSLAHCVVPAGSYLKSPGIAAPCPFGKYKAAPGSTESCTECTPGVTTAKEGSTSEADCSVLQPGYYATATSPSTGAIAAVDRCPQGFVCPGGKPSQASNPQQGIAAAPLLKADPSIVPCPYGTMTKDLGAISLDQCLTPPGYFTDLSSGKTVKCPSGSYRADWKPANQASSCVTCGEGVMADTTGSVTMYEMGSNQPYQVPVSASSDDCYIQPGQGLYYASASNTWRAETCAESQYGVSNITYGLKPNPCRDCPVGTVASKTAAVGSLRSAVGVKSADVPPCAPKAGYGVIGGAAQACSVGTFNPGGNLEPCKQCPRGTTTTAPGAGKSAADCVVAAGFGFDGASIEACPAGTYNDAVQGNMTTPCKACPTGLTTASTGSSSKADCKLCASGFGSWECATTCGGVGEGATYGPPGRLANQACLPCSSAGRPTGFSYQWGVQNDFFMPQTVARPGASSAFDCVSEYAQIVDGPWLLPIDNAGGTSTTNNVTAFAACVELCSATSCQLVTYDYQQQSCTMRKAVPAVPGSEVLLALKTVLARSPSSGAWSVPSSSSSSSSSSSGSNGDGSVDGSDGTMHAAVLDSDVAAKGVGSGKYTFYQDQGALEIGIQRPAPNAESFKSAYECLTACDETSDCAGFTVRLSVDRAKIGTTCQLVFGDASSGQGKRTVYRTDVTRMGLPLAHLCPSGFTTTAGGTQCVPMTTAQAVTLVLTAQGVCDAATTQYVRGVLTEYLSNPSTAFGVYVPRLQVDVSCLSAQTMLPDTPTTPTSGSTATSSEGLIALTVKVAYTGAASAASGLVQQLQTAPCGIPTICTGIRDLTLVRQWADGPSLKAGTLKLTVTSSQQANTSRVVATATYKEAGLVADMPFFVRVTPDAAVMANIACAQSESVQLGRSVMTCTGVLSPKATLGFTAMVPNPGFIGQPLMASATYTG